MQESGLEITVPVAACYVCPYMVTPYSTEGRISRLTADLSASIALPVPVVRKVKAGFEVLFAWDVVGVLRDAGHEAAKVILVDDDIETQLYWSIVKQAEHLGLSWVSVARALSAAHQKIGWTGVRIAKAVGLPQSTVSRYLKIVKELNPRMLAMAEKGRLTYSDARQLVKLPASKQDALAAEAQSRSWDNQKIMSKAFPFGHKGPAGSPDMENTYRAATPIIEKTADTKRLEAQISERLGFPFVIDLQTADGKSGKLKYQFFDRASLIDLLSAMRRGYSREAKPAGEIVVDFHSLDEFESLVGGFLAEE